MITKKIDGKYSLDDSDRYSSRESLLSRFHTRDVPKEMMACCDRTHTHTHAHLTIQIIGDKVNKTISSACLKTKIFHVVAVLFQFDRLSRLANCSIFT